MIKCFNPCSGLLCRTLRLVFLAWTGFAPVLMGGEKDVRHEIARESEQYRLAHFSAGRLPPKHDWKPQVTGRLGGTNRPAVPGGVGYGYYYYDPALLWTNSTVADYYVITPTFLGQGVSYLYLTATCRSKLGVEALVKYGASVNPAQFWVYDWSRPESNRWQVTIDLPIAHPEYLALLPDEFAVIRQMIHLRNATCCLGFTGGEYQWRNSVWLFNFNRGDWDLIYSHDYATAALTDNIYPAGGAANGFWGPIVETFDSSYGHVYPIGFELIRLFQDGRPAPSWLDATNSYGLATAPWQLFARTTNTSFVVGVNTGGTGGGGSGVGTLCVTANTNAGGFALSEPVGTNASDWVMTPWSNAWDKIVEGLPPGDYSITFSPVAGLATPEPQEFTIAGDQITTVRADYSRPQPRFQSVALADNALIFQWNSVTGLVYQLQFKTNLSQPDWLNLGEAVSGTGDGLSITDAIGPDPQRFYRIRQQ
jgi:hypothetical protein